MHESFDTIDDLNTVTGGYDWKEGLGVSAAVATVQALAAGNAFPKLGLMRRGPARVLGAIGGAVQGAAVDGLGQALRTK